MFDKRQSGEVDNVQEPEDRNNDEALLEYGRQLAMDSLLSDLKGAEIIEMPERNWSRRAWLSASVVSIAGIGTLALWRFGGGTKDAVAALDPRWILEAAEGARYEILASNRVKLISGELLFRSLESANLIVETLSGTAEASGTEFHIGCHQKDTILTQNKKQMNKINITRLLVLAGSVSLANANGKATAIAGEAIIAEHNKAPEKIIAEANSDFSARLYAQLAGQEKGNNLFFSPYSLSNGLMMLSEGARGTTALEIGKVLGLPTSMLRQGQDGQDIPWKMGVMRTGLKKVNKALVTSETMSPELRSLLQKEKELNKKAEAIWLEFEAVKDRLNLIRAEKGEEEEFQKVKTEYDAVRKQMKETDNALEKLESKTDMAILHLANAVWADRSINLLKEWEQTVSGTYGTGSIRQVDFRAQAEAAREEINAWAEEKTNGRIKKVVTPSTVNSMTRMVLANTVYFKAKWEFPFESSDTRQADFHLESGKKIEASLMFKEGDKPVGYAAFNADGSVFNTPKAKQKDSMNQQYYPAKDGFSLIEMPYKGGAASMVIVAPNDPEGLSRLEGRLTMPNLNSWVKALRKRKTNVLLPKFKMEANYDLKSSLSAMGMRSAFASHKANFTGISQDKEFSNNEIFVSDVVQKTFVEVNEKGTEAAAVTAVTMKSLSEILPNEEFIPTFRADRPFLYFIRDTKSGVILFMGRVMNPSL